MSQIALTRRGSWVKRFHTRTLIGEQNLGHHSFGVASLLLLLHPAPSVTLIKAALWHDMAEQEIGDVPSPALRADHEYGVVYDSLEREFLSKRLNVHLEGLSVEELAWLWGIDKLECLLFSREQARLGNMAFREICVLLYGWFRKEKDCPEIIKQVACRIEWSEIEKELEDLL